MKSAEIFSFCEFEEFYRFFEPCTPLGCQAKEERSFCSSLEEAARWFDLTATYLTLLSERREVVERIRFHLRRLPRTPAFEEQVFSQTDLFLFKKFLVNASEIDKLYRQFIPQESPSQWHVNLRAPLELLAAGSLDDETFYLSERNEPQLAKVRKNLEAIDAQIREGKRALLSQIQMGTGIDFQLGDFMVLPLEKVATVDTILCSVEPLDGIRVTVRPRLGRELLELMSMRCQEVNHERELEAQVLGQLSLRLHLYREVIEGAIAALTELDLSLARALVAEKFILVRPTLLGSGRSAIVVEQGRLLPLEERCRVLNERYQPLNFAPADRIVVLRGANMGGKTMVLKTLTFLQTLAQMGFFVPATYFESGFFNKVSLIGLADATSSAGLSSFGAEIARVIEILEQKSIQHLILIDEFGRTTNSREGAALLAALLQRLSENSLNCSICSTHFMNLPRLTGVTFLRMRGLSARLGMDESARLPQDHLAARLLVLNQNMEYELVADEPSATVSDAIRIAELLGLDGDLVTKAKHYLEISDEEQIGSGPT